MTIDPEALRRWEHAARTLAGEPPLLPADRESAAPVADEAASVWHATAPAVTAAATRRAVVAAGTDAAWERMRRRLAAPTGRPTRVPRVSTTARWRIAALAATLLGAVALGVATQRRGADTGRTYRTGPGERVTLNLADGSVVVLRGNSALRVSDARRGWSLPGLRAGTATGRTVALEGEAYFTVVHDDRRPFRVYAAGAVAEDVGTRFSVRAYPADPAVRVAVTEGAVAVGRRDDGRAARRGDRPPVLLTAGDVGRIERDGTVQVTHGGVPDDVTAWVRDRLVARDRPLAEVAAELTAVFGRTVAVADSAVGRRRVSFDLPATALADVVGAVALALDLDVTITADAMTFRVGLPE
jgi:transmembrane sensor